MLTPAPAPYPRTLLPKSLWCGVLPATVSAIALILAIAAPAATAASTSRDITSRLFAASPEAPLDLSDESLANLDLSQLDFKEARLAGADLFGSDLTGADLSGTDLTDARLDRTTIIRTRFARAKLTGATILRPSTSAGLSPNPTEAANFDGADLRDARLFGRFSGASFRAADLSGATLAPFGRTGFIEHIWRSELQAADFTGAKLVKANLDKALLAFARLRNADLSGATLKEADLTQADLSGASLRDADLTGAILEGANLDGADLQGVKGLPAVRSLSGAASPALHSRGDP